MLQETSIQPHASLSLAEEAPWSRVEFAPPGSWVEEEPCDATTPAGEGLDITHLCLARQVDVGSGRAFHATAVRLETVEAAERESRWKLPLDARLRRLTLHWLRVRREGAHADRLQRERLRLLQDQAGESGPDGRWILVADLDELRPGDIVEAAYTAELHDPIRPGGCEVFFTVPPRAVVGRHRLSVRFGTGHAPLRWLASADAPERHETILPDGSHRWSWEGAQSQPRDEETNSPANRMDFVWVQVSDLPDWSLLAGRMAEAWTAAGDGVGLGEIAAFAKPGKVDAEAIVRLVTHLQETFRHPRPDPMAKGRIPLAPAKVARRRQGDGKDLAWLATTVLRGWGLRARPVLVATALREAVAELLPMAELFDHAVLEVESEGRTRWFDLAESGQGGDFGTRAVPWFGHGLPLEGADKGLHAQPGERARGVYALRETVLLDTTRGGVSLVEERVRAEGWPADRLRLALGSQGPEAFAEERERGAQRRHGRARRLGGLRWRDDPAANVFELVEVFELSDAMRPEERGQRAAHAVPPGLVAGWLALPEDKLRRGPWVLPFPCELQHTLIIKAPGLGAGAGRRRLWTEPEFEASQEDTRLKGAWTRVYRFTTLVPEVPARRVPAYRKALEEFFRDAVWRIYLPWGVGRMRRGKGFGELDEAPAPEQASPGRVEETVVPAPAAAPRPVAPAGDGGLAAEFKRDSHGRRRRRSHERSSSGDRRSKLPGWVWKIGLGVLAVLLLALLRDCMRGP